MKEVASEFVFRRRPIRLLMVLVLAHHKNVHRFARGRRPFRGKLVLDAFEQIVVPVNNDIGGREFERVVAEFNVADAPTKAGVPADLYQQALTIACRVRAAVGLNPHVVPDCAAQKNVVPAADMQRWNLNI